MEEYNPFSLKNKIILVTGAAAGIGKEIALQCAKLGATLIVVDRDEEGLKVALSVLEGQDRMHQKILADLTKNSDIERIVEECPKLDGCVNNAGIVGLTPVQFINSEKIEQMHKINLIAPMLLTKSIFKAKKFNNSASIVFTSSVAGVYRVSMGNAIYATAKCGIDAFMRSVALEFAPKGIRCNSVNPAMVETNILKRGQLTAEQYEEDKKNYPLKRYGTPYDVAMATIFLLSDASSWITGTAVKLDGGVTLK